MNPEDTMVSEISQLLTDKICRIPSTRGPQSVRPTGSAGRGASRKLVFPGSLRVEVTVTVVAAQLGVTDATVRNGSPV